MGPPSPGGRTAALAEVPGLIWRDGGAVRQNPPAFVEDLDDLDDPAWDLCDFQLYAELDREEVDETVCHVQTTRGCPNHCTYCLGAKINGNRLRRFSAARVAGQVRTLAGKHGGRRFSFADDNLTADRGKACAVFEAIAALPVKARWDLHSNGVGSESLDAEVVRLMEAAGCDGITLGVESGSPRLLARMGRTWYSEESLHRAIAMIHANSRMRISAFFILGYPDEDDRDVRATVGLVGRLDLDNILINVFTPWPGTPITGRLEKDGLLPPYAPGRWSYDQVTMPTRHIPAWRLRAYHTLIYAAFYGRPTRLRLRIRQRGARGFARDVGSFAANLLRPRALRAVGTMVDGTTLLKSKA